MNYRKLAHKYLNKKNDNNSQTITALAVGLVAGAIISILFAPKKGIETRRGLVDRSKKFYGSIKDKFGVACDQFNQDIKNPNKTERITKKKTSFAKKKPNNIKKNLEH